MAAIQSSSFLCSQRGITKAAIHIPKLNLNSVSLPKLKHARGFVQDVELKRSNGYTETTIEKSTHVCDRVVIEKLYAVMDAVADRVEMHKNICDQRANWNSLLLTSINTITLSAATRAGIAATSTVGSPLLALKISSTLMYLAATGMLVIMNKIQPSQLAEEQRNATRLCKLLHNQIQTLIAIGNPTAHDVDEAMEKILAIDKAFPLPLLGKMIEKFPSAVEPTVWWPKHKRGQGKGIQRSNGNGWNEEMEVGMKEIVSVLNMNDKADYLRLGEKALKINKVMAMAGPLLTCLAAVGSAFVGSPSHGSWAAVLGVAAGALASVVNTLEHGGQVGMVVELYRSNAGFFKQMEEDIEFNLNETDVDRRENGELFEMKVALNLGRSLSELRDLATCSKRSKGDDFEEFGSKLF